jgi:hypothetical protein
MAPGRIGIDSDRIPETPLKMSNMKDTPASQVFDSDNDSGDDLLGDYEEVATLPWQSTVPTQVC